MNKTFILIAGVLLASTALAAHNRPYGAAGCGLGSQLFKSENGATSQILAATTNGTSGSQTFGISSGSSNCTDDGYVRASRQVPMFVETNQVALANDIARGNGETLAHLSKVLGCSSTNHIGAVLQKNYGSIFTTENIKESKVTGSILGVIKSNTQLAGECKYII